MTKAAPRTKSFYRAVSPDGRPQKWRRSELWALRDAVYHVKGWGKRGDNGVTISCDTHVAQNYLDEVMAAGWTFEVTKVAA